jgi:hypothetical protein
MVTVGIAEGSTDDDAVLQSEQCRAGGGALAGGWFSAIVRIICVCSVADCSVDYQSTSMIYDFSRFRRKVIYDFKIFDNRL